MSNLKIDLEECKKDPACDPIEIFIRHGLIKARPNKGLVEDAYDMADATSDFIRDHNIGGDVGRSIADSLDSATDRHERETGEAEENEDP